MDGDLRYTFAEDFEELATALTELLVSQQIKLREAIDKSPLLPLFNTRHSLMIIGWIGWPMKTHRLPHRKDNFQIMNGITR